jgi:hypothetical protein
VNSDLSIGVLVKTELAVTLFKSREETLDGKAIDAVDVRLSRVSRGNLNAKSINGIQESFFVVATTNLKNELNSGFARVKRDTLAHMLYLNHVGVVAGAYVEDTCERAGAVG